MPVVDFVGHTVIVLGCYPFYMYGSEDLRGKFNAQ